MILIKGVKNFNLLENEEYSKKKPGTPRYYDFY